MTGRRAVPTFIGVGVQKGGTTWLYHQLRAHPGFWMPPVKEFSFLDRPFPADNVRRIAKEARRSEEPRCRAFCERLLALDIRPDHPVEAYLSLFEPAGALLTGEITPTYAALPEARFEALARRLRGTKVVVMVRDPVQRAWSNLNDAVNLGYIPHESVADPAAMIATPRVERFARVSYPSDARRRWSRAFEARRVFLEDVVADAGRTRAGILGVLGASADAQVALAFDHDKKAGRRRAADRRAPPCRRGVLPRRAHPMRRDLRRPRRAMAGALRLRVATPDRGASGPSGHAARLRPVGWPAIGRADVRPHRVRGAT